jgi:hypothetical protein
MIEASGATMSYVVQSTGGGILALFGAPLATRTIHNARYTRRCGCRKS